MNILFIGDMVGKGSRKAAKALVPELRQRYDCDLVIANGENMAGGGGISAKCLRDLDSSGIDVYTGGDHMWDQRSLVDEISALPNVLRPANLNPRQPGRGSGIFYTKENVPVGVACLQGRTFMQATADCPFTAADRIIAELRNKTKVIIVDFHAEATSEKIAMGYYLDGRVAAVLGTHTHVATADERILPKGTAYQTDVGMVGGRESVLGRDIQPVLQRFSTGMPARFTVVEKNIRMHATLVKLDAATGRARQIERIVRDWG